MSISRRKFLAGSGSAGLLLLGGGLEFSKPGKLNAFRKAGEFTIISTWDHGIAANAEAVRRLESGGNALDAVEYGVRVTEDDPKVSSVGYGGYPNEAGEVELDASIMWGLNQKAGAVAAIRNIKNPISVARLVMERTKHVMLVGIGAEEFAVAQGFKRENLLTSEAREAWIKWKAISSQEDDEKPEDSHDTIGMVALDGDGNLAGACTTSGLAWKLPGRVGDSPIIGAGMYVDNEVGGAASTGVGEEVIKICGSFLVVENMRRGMNPEEACDDALKRILKNHDGSVDFQVAFIALRKDGKVGGSSLKKGFEYALYSNGKNELHDAKSI